MIFRTFIPRHTKLRKYINCYWYITQSQEETTSINPKMVPDGHYYMIINLGYPHHFIDTEGKIISSKMSHINTYQSNSFNICRTGSVEIIGIIFKPYGLFPLFNIPIHEVSGFILNVENILGNHIKEVEEQLSFTLSTEQKINKVEEWLLKVMNLSDPSEYEKIVEFTVNLLKKNNGLLRIKQVLNYVNVSERSLERYFKQLTGITPKQFAVICRIQHVLHNMRIKEKNIASYAIDGGFYDQSHFNHNFKSLTGTTPLAYLLKRDHLSDLYNTTSKK